MPTSQISPHNAVYSMEPHNGEDGSASLMLDPGSSWTVPLYSCIIKTVSFRFNGSDDLSGLTITNPVDKVYPNETSKPLWRVEQTLTTM